MTITIGHCELKAKQAKGRDGQSGHREADHAGHGTEELIGELRSLKCMVFWLFRIVQSARTLASASRLCEQSPQLIESFRRSAGSHTTGTAVPHPKLSLLTSVPQHCLHSSSDVASILLIALRGQGSLLFFHQEAA
jgi:hypothetical protein